MQPAIQILAERLIEARGYEHYLAYVALKSYIESLDDVAFGLEIDRVTNPDIFRYLMSIGLPMRRQSVVSLKWRELEK